MIRTLIIEDEAAAAKRIERMLKNADPEIYVSGIIDSVEKSVNVLLQKPQPDLIILDIELSDGQCFEIFRMVEVSSFIIFTTAYDNFAIKAFEQNSIDYLLKPIDENKLRAALQKFKLFTSKNQQNFTGNLLQSIENQKMLFKKRFLVYAGNTVKSIETSLIAYFYSLEKGTFLCTTDNRHYQIEYSLDRLEDLVDPEHYFRINRRQMVSFNSIGKIHILSKSRIKLEIKPEQKEEFLVSATRTHAFRQWLDK
jgi:DNA-binding LytR/AlgR family response regulator